MKSLKVSKCRIRAERIPYSCSISFDRIPPSSPRSAVQPFPIEFVTLLEAGVNAVMLDVIILPRIDQINSASASRTDSESRSAIAIIERWLFCRLGGDSGP